MFYRCKSCGGNVTYNPDKKKMICESCGNEGEPELISQDKKHVCNNCGAEIEADQIDLSLKCPYCGTYVIFEDRMENEYEPNLVLPFAIDKHKALDLLKEKFAKQLFLPGNFCSSSTIESMEGLYVPFWMYDLHTHVHFEGEADKIRTWEEGDYDCTETSTYRIVRDFDVDYDKIPVDASKAMPDAMMDLVEPYKYEALGEFDAKFLSGFQAEIYDENKEELLPRAQKKAKKYTEGYLDEYNNSYSSVKPAIKKVDSKEMNSYYTFLPVWRYVYRYQGTNYEFFVNGQTGKAIGTPPTSKARMFSWFAAVTFSLFFLAEMILYFLEVA